MHFTVNSRGINHSYTMMLLLGAGASKATNIPTTVEMAEEFLKLETDGALKTQLEPVSQDIETLIRLIYRSKNALEIHPSIENNIGKIYGSNKPSEDLDDLESRIQRYISRKCKNYNLAEAERIYRPLLNLSNSLVLHIFTTNYDTVVEDTCEKFRFRYDDGFIGNKKYQEFDHTSFLHSPIQLFKLHGSINWWKDLANQDIFKMEVDLEGATKVAQLMIYPARDKDIFEYPYYIFQSYFATQLDKVDEIVAIGHRFNDPHLLSAVQAGLARNKNLTLKVVNPSASSIAEDKFSNFKENQVVILEEGFEDWVNSINEYTGKARKFDLRLQSEKKKAADNLIDAYKRTDDFKMTVKELCDSRDTITAVVPSPSNLSTLDLSKMANALPATLERMLHPGVGLAGPGDAAGERVCANCGHNFRRDTVMTPRCPECGCIVI